MNIFCFFFLPFSNTFLSSKMRSRVGAKPKTSERKNSLTPAAIGSFTKSKQSLSTSPKNATESQIQNLLGRISNRLERVHSKRQKVSECVRAIRSQGIRLIGPGPKLSQNAKAKMVALYQGAQKQCEIEHASLEQILGDIQRVRQLHLRHRMSDKLSRGSLMVLLAQHAVGLPLYIGSIDGHPPPLVGAIPQEPNEPIPESSFVAAFVEDIWILAEVKRQLSATRYEVRDIDEDDDDLTAGAGAEKLLSVSASRLIPLPHFRADPRRHAHALFPTGAVVLALYPQTTCFYKGVVENPPTGPNDDYMVAFEDSTFPSGYSPTLPVPQLYVLTHYELPVVSQRRNRQRSTQSSDMSDDTFSSE